jgi:tRNA A37 threonylcarbamoyladenosine dehydratase
MAKTQLLILGAGGLGSSVAEAGGLSGQFEVVLFDDSIPISETE